MLFGGITVLAAVAAVIIGCLSDAFGSLAWLWVLPCGFIGSWLGLLILALLFLLAVTLMVDKSKKQEKDDSFYRSLYNLYLPALLWLAGVRVETGGLEKIPQSGRFLLVCNHQHEIDPGVLIRYFPRSQLTFVAKREAGDMHLVGRLMHKIRCPLLNRGNDRDGLRVILDCIRMIKNDEVSVGIFPEGGILGYRKLYPFRPGVFKIAQKAEVPIAVCTMTGTEDFVRNLKRLKKTPVTLRLLEVIPAAELKGVHTTQIADRVFKMMADDLGPDWKLPENA